MVVCRQSKKWSWNLASRGVHRRRVITGLDWCHIVADTSRGHSHFLGGKLFPRRQIFATSTRCLRRDLFDTLALQPRGQRRYFRPDSYQVPLVMWQCGVLKGVCLLETCSFLSCVLTCFSLIVAKSIAPWGIAIVMESGLFETVRVWCSLLFFFEYHSSLRWELDSSFELCFRLICIFEYFYCILFALVKSKYLW